MKHAHFEMPGVAFVLVTYRLVQRRLNDDLVGFEATVTGPAVVLRHGQSLVRIPL